MRKHVCLVCLSLSLSQDSVFVSVSRLCLRLCLTAGL